ncbi:MAG: amino acid ABC transporter permease [Papillibacter sp.]|jgi:polar amino acid transport system permease protein|nr:amino acid ABC transporter permease [Papillibacter sp.]
MTLQTMVAVLASGMLRSILIYVLTLIGALPLGLLVAFGRMSKIKPLQLFVKFYISVMRGTPLMLQLMVVFFGPYFLLGISLGTNYRFIAVIIGFVINYAAYFAEIYRGGIESIAVGQREAAQVLGYSRSDTFLRIILPQVIKRILPAITNEMITLVKDTSLAFAISYSEMFTMAKKIASSQSTLLPFVIAGLFYYIFNFAVAYLMEMGEKRLSYYR